MFSIENFVQNLNLLRKYQNLAAHRSKNMKNCGEITFSYFFFLLLSRFKFVSRDTSNKNSLESSVFCVKFTAESDFDVVLVKKRHPLKMRADLCGYIEGYQGFLEVFSTFRVLNAQYMIQIIYHFEDLEKTRRLATRRSLKKCLLGLYNQFSEIRFLPYYGKFTAF